MKIKAPQMVKQKNAKSPELFIKLKIHLFNGKKFERVPNKDFFVKAKSSFEIIEISQPL